MWIPKLSSDVLTLSDGDKDQADKLNTFWILLHKELIKMEISPSGFVELKNTDDVSLGSVTLDLADNAKVTDVDIGEDPGTYFEFLAFAVTSPVEWPADITDKDSLDIMGINE